MNKNKLMYGILLTKEQLDFLKDDWQGFHRMTAFDTFVSMASTKPSVYPPVELLPPPAHVGLCEEKMKWQDAHNTPRHS